jgi:hypothetical protein
MDYTELFNDFEAEIQRHRSRENLVIYGAGLTSNLLYEAIRRSSRFKVDCFAVSRVESRPFFTADFDAIPVLAFEDARLDEENQVVVLGTNPLYYPEITSAIRERYKKIKIIPLLNNESIRERVDRINDKKKRMDTHYREIKVVVESQPRSGTTWMLHSLIKHFNGNFSSPFAYDYTPVQHQVYPDIYYRDWPGPLVVFSHFFNPVSHHVTSRYPVIYPIRYIYDCYYSWGYLQYRHRREKKNHYFLSAGSEEWAFIKEKIPQNKMWLEMIKDRNYFRYEDWQLAKEKNVEIMKRAVPGLQPNLFQVRPEKNRLYYDGNYRSKMDKDVFDTLKENFQEFIHCYWPEKKDDNY